MARRYELTEQDWRRVEPLLPPSTTRRGGRRFRDHRQVLNGVLWVLHTGAQWREMPERYGPWSTAYRRHARWSGDGTLDRILLALRLELDDKGLIDHELWLTDGTSVRAGRSAAGAKKGRAAAMSRRITPLAARAAASGRSSTC